ncbi:MAG: pyruvate ferredoxin oxidoreductase [Candidatus Lokiarchaeota archaeon]|nr:pyruvate ferredoxin oxidoreductase [Candidatus Lokiarchaeota archaeon]
MTNTESEFEGIHLLKGNYAAAYAARAANVQVVTAFPITPQTLVVEKISELVDSGKMNCEFIRMESEHSVMTGLIGASIAGARTFTGTSGQGLLYMSEPVHWAAGTRLPIVMSIASRGIAPPWNIWADFSDVITQRDSGWLIQLTATHQEIYDSILMAYKISEDPDVMLPSMVAYGGFILSHTSKPVDMPPQAEIDAFLPQIPDQGWEHIFLDAERPMMHGALIMPGDFYQEFRMKIQLAQIRAKDKIKQVSKKFGEKFGRYYGNGLFEEYNSSDAEYIIINCGEIAKQMEIAVDSLRKEGYKVGMIRLRTYRPFPSSELVQAVKHAKIVGVVDRATAFGSPTGGPISTDVRAALQDDPNTRNLTVVPFINGIGGRDVLPEEQRGQFETLFHVLDKGTYPKTKDLMDKTYWTGTIDRRDS